jgi:hypothetical protein
MQSSVADFFQLKVKRKQRFQVRRQFQHFKYDMNRTIDATISLFALTQIICIDFQNTYIGMYLHNYQKH